MKQYIVSTCGLAGEATDPLNNGADSQALKGATSVASRTPIPRLRYTLQDFDRTWFGKFNQMLVDHLHGCGD